MDQPRDLGQLFCSPYQFTPFATSRSRMYQHRQDRDLAPSLSPCRWSWSWCESWASQRSSVSERFTAAGAESEAARRVRGGWSIGRRQDHLGGESGDMLAAAGYLRLSASAPVACSDPHPGLCGGCRSCVGCRLLLLSLARPCVLWGGGAWAGVAECVAVRWKKASVVQWE
jgi:hypothetical protein